MSNGKRPCSQIPLQLGVSTFVFFFCHVSFFPFRDIELGWSKKLESRDSPLFIVTWVVIIKSLTAPLALAQFHQPPFTSPSYELFILQYSRPNLLTRPNFLNPLLPEAAYKVSQLNGSILPVPSAQSSNSDSHLPPFPAPPTQRPVKWRVNPLLVSLAAFCRVLNHRKLHGQGTDPVIFPRYVALEEAVGDLVELVCWRPDGRERVTGTGGGIEGKVVLRMVRRSRFRKKSEAQYRGRRKGGGERRTFNFSSVFLIGVRYFFFSLLSEMGPLIVLHLP